MQRHHHDTEQKVARFDFSPDADLLEQIESRVGKPKMYIFAERAYAYMAHLYTQPAADQHAQVAQASPAVISRLEADDEGSLIAAVFSAAVMEAVKNTGLPMTAAQKIDGATAILSERYQAGW